MSINNNGDREEPIREVTFNHLVRLLPYYDFAKGLLTDRIKKAEALRQADHVVVSVYRPPPSLPPSSSKIDFSVATLVKALRHTDCLSSNKTDYEFRKKTKDDELIKFKYSDHMIKYMGMWKKRSLRDHECQCSVL